MKQELITALGSTLGPAAVLAACLVLGHVHGGESKPVLPEMHWADDLTLLPVGAAPSALEVPHFANRLQAFIWRN